MNKIKTTIIKITDTVDINKIEEKLKDLNMTEQILNTDEKD